MENSSSTRLEKFSSQVRVRPVTAKAKVIRRQAESTIKTRNREMHTTIQKIEEDMQKEMDESKAKLDCSIKGESLGGLHNGIEDVADNVTLTQAETKIIGKKAVLEGRMSVQDFEAISDCRKSRLEDANWKTDILSVDVGGHEVVAILEQDGK